MAETTTTSIPQGLNPALDPAATQTGPTASATQMTVSFVLKARNLDQLEQEVSAGWQGPYLSTAQFAASYGQSPQTVSALESYLGSFGISSSSYADGLDVTATGTADQFNRALKILLDNYNIPGHRGSPNQRVYTSKSNPTLPNQLGSSILSVLGLTNYRPFVSQAVKSLSHRSLSAPTTSVIPSGELTPADFTQHYNLLPVESSGAVGQGQTMGIVTLASIDPTVPATFWNILGLHTLPNRLTLKNVDGGAGPVSLAAESDETTLDVEQSGAIAPQSKIIVYQAPPTDYGFVDAFLAAASDNLAGSVSASWGESETDVLLTQIDGTESPTLSQAFDQAELEMGAQGQSSFVSAGDQGPFEAIPATDAGTTNLTVLSPADGPYITAAGGTTLPGLQTYPILNQAGVAIGGSQSVTIPKEIGWSWDYQWPLYATFGATSEADVATDFDDDYGSGGGYSRFEPEPSYQRGVSGVATDSHVSYLTPTDFSGAQGLLLPTAFAFNPKPTVSSGPAPGGRVVPDLSFDADPATGYAVYDPQFEATYGTDILQYGGTSIVAPQLNATTAVLASSLGHRLGFWNPVIYSAAQSSNSPFTPLSDNHVYGSSYFSQTNANGTTSPLAGSFSNNNLYYTGTPGTIYNPVTGLGFANLAGLRQFFAR